MKRIIFLLTVVFTALASASCSKIGGSYDDTYASQILGEWEVTKVEENGKTINSDIKSISFTYGWMVAYMNDEEWAMGYYINEHEKTIRIQEGAYNKTIATIKKLTSSQLVLDWEYVLEYDREYVIHLKRIL